MAYVVYKATDEPTMTANDLQISERALRGEIQSLKIWGGGIAIAAVSATVSILFAALHYWPPHTG